VEPTTKDLTRYPYKHQGSRNQLLDGRTPKGKHLSLWADFIVTSSGVMSYTVSVESICTVLFF